jgi:hypothetical protein
MRFLLVPIELAFAPSTELHGQSTESYYLFGYYFADSTCSEPAFEAAAFTTSCDYALSYAFVCNETGCTCIDIYCVMDMGTIVEFPRIHMCVDGSVPVQLYNRQRTSIISGHRHSRLIYQLYRWGDTGLRYRF